MGFGTPPKILQSLLDLRIRQRPVHRFVEHRDDLRWSAGGHAEAVRGHGFVTRHEFAHGWNVRQRLRTRRARDCECTQPARPDVADRQGNGTERDLHLAGKEIVHRQRRAAIRHVHHSDARHEVEQFAGNVLRRSHATRSKVDFAWIGFGVGDEFGNGLGREGRVHLHHERQQIDVGHRRNVVREVVVEFGVKRRVDFVGGGRPQQGVAVGRRARDRLGRDSGPGAGPVLDHKRLAEFLRQKFTDQARDNVSGAAGRKADNDLDRPGRIIERVGKPRPRRRRRNGNCETKESAATKAHRNLSNPPGRHFGLSANPSVAGERSCAKRGRSACGNQAHPPLTRVVPPM